MNNGRMLVQDDVAQGKQATLVGLWFACIVLFQLAVHFV